MDSLDIDEQLPRAASKTLKLDIARMTSLEKTDTVREGHALSPKEHELILGVCDLKSKTLMYSNSLKK